MVGCCPWAPSQCATLHKGTRDGLVQQGGADIASVVLRTDLPVQVQKLTDGFIKDVDSMCDQKEAELQKI